MPVPVRLPVQQTLACTEGTDIGILRVRVGVDNIRVCDDTRRLEDVHIVQVYSYGQDVQVLVFV